MILVDSSAFIEYYRPSGNPRVRDAVAAAVASDQVAVNGIVRVEILGFAAGDEERRLLTSDFQAFHDLPLDRAAFDLACDLGFDLRRRGYTVPATDLVIAASALRGRAHLYHVDGHFDRIAELSDLEATHLSPPAGHEDPG